MKMIGRYEILGRLGQGGMGSVYKGRLPELGRVVAVKLLDPIDHMIDLLGLEAIEREFIKEARIMADLNHPHIAGVWDIGRHDGKSYFVMEYVCDNLGSLIGEDYIVEEPTRRLRPEKALTYAMETLSGLAALHHHGIIHRDVKPYNILVTLYDQVRIIDFGLSKLRGEQTSDRPAAMMVGSPYYTAPEQEQDPDCATAASDLFSVGVMLYRFLTGVLPPHVGGPEEGPGLVDLFPGVMDDSWHGFFGRALASNPAKRYQDAISMQEALAGLYEDYREKLDAACTLLDEEERSVHPCDAQPGSVRSHPIRTGPRNGLASLGLNRLGKPEVCHPNDFSVRDGVVLDRNTSLEWEVSGSLFPMTWEEVASHVDRLNRNGHLGRNDWRLPTVSELATLVDGGETMSEFCVDSVFDHRQKRLWSSDRRTYTSSWSLNAAMGYIGCHDHTCRLYVRCVRQA